MTIALVTPAESEPVTVAEAKTHCRVDFSTDDTYIGTLITAATDWVQRRTGRQLVSATFRQSWDTYPYVVYPTRQFPQWGGSHVWIPGMEGYGVTLDREPVSAVSWVKYYDANDVLQTVDSSTYWTDFDSTPPRVIPKTTWPNIYFGRPNAFQVQFVAGYGAASAVPQALRTAVKWLVAHWYELREPVVMGSIASVPLSVESVCQQYETRIL